MKETAACVWGSRTCPDTAGTQVIYSYLKSEKAKAILRNHILKSLNEILNGEILDFETEIRIEGLPDVGFVDKKIEELRGGDVAFMDILNSLKY